MNAQLLELCRQVEHDQKTLNERLARQESLRQQMDMSIQEQCRCVMDGSDMLLAALQTMMSENAQLRKQLAQQTQQAKMHLKLAQKQHTQAIQEITQAAKSYEQALQEQYGKKNQYGKKKPKKLLRRRQYNLRRR